MVCYFKRFLNDVCLLQKENKKCWCCMKKNNVVDMKEIIVFCTQYNSFGYGEALITGVPSGFVVSLYNAGYSDNEEMDSLFRSRYKRAIILDNHPCLIVRFLADDFGFKYSLVLSNGSLAEDCSFYEKKDVFTHKLEIR